MAGKTLLAHAIDAFSRHAGMDGVVLVIAEGQKNEVSAALDGRAPPPCVTGGATRRQSAKAGLAYIAATGGAGNVLIHEDRKSVVSGRSWAGRVDLGGRRIVKKKQREKRKQK